MKVPYFKYIRPTNIKECLDFLNQYGHQVAVMAGGTDLLVQLKQRTELPTYVIDLQDILNDAIVVEEQILRIGPMTRLADIRDAKVIRERVPVLAHTAGKIGAIQHQYMGTIGGNVCLNTRCLYYNRTPQWKRSWVGATCLKAGGETCHAAPRSKQCFALYQGDMAATLITLKSLIKIASSQGEKTIPLQDFFTADGVNPNILQKNEIVTEVLVPLSCLSQKGIYLKLRNRESTDFPMVGVALAVETDNIGIITSIRMAINGIHSAPVIVPEIEDIFLQKKVYELKLRDEKKAELRKLVEKRAKTIDNALGSPQYRREMAGVFALMALEQICDNAC